MGERDPSRQEVPDVCPPAGVQAILVALDDRESSHRAADMASRLAATTGARVALLHVIDVSRVYDPDLGFADNMLSSDMRPDAEDLLDRYQGVFPSRSR